MCLNLWCTRLLVGRRQSSHRAPRARLSMTSPTFCSEIIAVMSRRCPLTSGSRRYAMSGGTACCSCMISTPRVSGSRPSQLSSTNSFRRIVTLPLWNPVPIAVGAVGFLKKPSGSFVTLFNCFYPEKAANGDSGLPSVYGYGRVTTGNQRQDKRTAAQRGLDAITGLLTFKTRSDGPISYVLRLRVLCMN
jgi:hypothetical protein